MSKRRKRFTIKLTEAEINAILGAVGNVDAVAMSEDIHDEAERDQWLADLESALEKLRTTQ